MAAATTPEKLNELLEDALEDLLLEDEPADATVETAGKPNIHVSLEKITQLSKNQSDVKNKNKSKGKKSAVASVASSSSTSDNLPDSKVGFVDEEEMNRFFAEMTSKLRSELPRIDPGEAQARLSESVPQIFDLMQNLLSKELLYPALKDLAPKFSEWLEKNLGTLSKEDRQRYKKQLGKIREIIDVFDDETLQDQERFEKNLELMEQMQSLGAPPEELTVPDGMSKCSIM